jgi:hypothetical protein
MSRPWRARAGAPLLTAIDWAGRLRREKFAPLPRVISKAAKRTRMFAVRQLAYWPPGPDLAIFYRQDNETIPDPGIIILGKIRSGIEVFSVRGSIRVTLELAEQPPSAS